MSDTLSQLYESLVINLWKVSLLLENTDYLDPDWTEIKGEYDLLCSLARSHGIDVDTL